MTNKATDTNGRHENKTEHDDNSNNAIKDDASVLGQEGDKIIELHSDINKIDGQSDTKENFKGRQNELSWSDWY